MYECIYNQKFGGKWNHWFCCHVWGIVKKHTEGKITYEQSKCVDCGRVETMILIDWID